MDSNVYDTAIIGGGLAGLSLAILLADKHFKVILCEKETYPFHKVCGEYISMESWNFIESLGLPLDKMDLPVIKKLIITSPDGNMLNERLDLGGFGISRYNIDERLKEVALKKGVCIIEACQVEDVSLAGDVFTLKSARGNYFATVCCGSFGKRSNFDIKWKRPFTKKINDKLSNYVGIKYHIETTFPADTIALHNFKDGYCGISRIEDGKYCLCYLTNAQNLKLSNNSIDEMEKNILGKNKYLKEIFQNSKKLYDRPVSISQISFNRKSQVENNVLLLGDAAGMITPLCGNGMSIAMHTAKIASVHISDFLKQNISRAEMEKRYIVQWNKTFAARLRTGRIVQRFFGKTRTTNLFIKIMKSAPWLTRTIIRKTHGKAF